MTAQCFPCTMLPQVCQVYVWSSGTIENSNVPGLLSPSLPDQCSRILKLKFSSLEELRQAPSSNIFSHSVLEMPSEST